MADTSELLTTVARVRRAMPRNPDVMVLCDAIEGFVMQMPLKYADTPECTDKARARRG